MRSPIGDEGHRGTSYAQSSGVPVNMWKSDVLLGTTYILNNPVDESSNRSLLKGVDLGTLVQICQKELSNHTPDTELVLMVFVHVFRQRLDALLSSDAGLKAGQN